MKKVSTKRAKQLREYAILREAYYHEHLFCEVCGFAPTTEIHHTNKRNGERLNDVRYWLAVCRDCHVLIHSEPKWSREHGYLI